MLGENIKYTDYNGVEREERFYFNLSKAELMEMELGVAGGLSEILKQIIAAQDVPKIMDIFKKLVLKAYGEKSPDGKRFIKKDKDGTPLANYFEETAAYSELYMKLSTDADYAAKFVRGIIPSDIDMEEAQKMMDNVTKDANLGESSTNNVIPLINDKGE